MPNLRDIRNRIRSVKNTQQLTYAMKLVSATKLRRAQERILSARPYSRQMLQVLKSLATRAHSEKHPLLERREERRVELVVITADRGLCGGFNSNILKAAVEFLEERRGKEITLSLVGKRGRDYFRRRPYPIRREMVDIFRNVTYSHAAELAQDQIERYRNREVDAFYLLYNEFKSAMQQGVTVEELLPIQRMEPDASGPPTDYIYEPAQEILFDRLLPKYVETQVFHALLESSASEQGARMTAMDSATRNAKDMIESLTLNMNKVRQAGITKEILEVVSGAAALD